MLYVVSILVPTILFVGFLFVTSIERRRSTRYFAGVRSSLDERMNRYSYIASHVDFASFVRDSIRALSARVVHDIAHGTLIVVRFAERMLTRAVRALRAHRIELGASRSESAQDKE